MFKPYIVGIVWAAAIFFVAGMIAATWDITQWPPPGRAFTGVLMFLMFSFTWYLSRGD